jgi:hypothetical protein
MHALRAAYHVAKVNLLVRLRDRRILAVVAGGVYLGHLVLAGDIELTLAGQNYRGVENAAWIGTLMSLTASFVTLLFGFYLVNGALDRDRRARLGSLIASSPAGSLAYLLGTWAGSTLLLLGLGGVMMGSAAVLFVLRGHGIPHPVPLLVPFLLFTGPVAALTAAVALAFDCVPGLRGRVGRIVYFFLAMGTLVLPITASLPVDPLGMTALHDSMIAALRAQHPDAAPGAMFAFGYFKDVGTLTTFTWPGVTATADLLLRRTGFVLASLDLVAGSGVFFRRFDPSPEEWARYRRWVGALVSTDAGESASIPTDPSSRRLSELLAEDEKGEPPRVSFGALSGERTLRPVRLVWAELTLALRSRSWGWWMGAIGLIVAGFVVPNNGGILILAWLWPLTLWSALGTRATVHRTAPLLATALYPRAQRMAAWAAGAVVALGMGLGPLLLGGTGGVLVGAAFVPALALAAGRLSGTPRLFEVTFLLLWYLGPANRQAALDFSGVTAAPPATQIGYLGAAVVLLGMGVVGRRSS